MIFELLEATLKNIIFFNLKVKQIMYNIYKLFAFKLLILLSTGCFGTFFTIFTTLLFVNVFYHFFIYQILES